jgi:multiple sugar transport system permease protein
MVRKSVLVAFAVVIAIWSFTPIYTILNISFMAMNDVVHIPGFILPHDPTLNQYLRLFGYNIGGVVTGGTEQQLRAFGQSKGLITGLINILIIAPVVMLITMLTAVPAGYALGRFRIGHRNAYLGLLLGSRTLPPVSVVIPYYFLFKNLHLLGTPYALIIADLSITIPIITWILTGFFGSLPRDVEKAARVDGARMFQAFRYAVLPLALPGLGATAVLAFLYPWNEFLNAWLLTGGSVSGQVYNSFMTSFFAMQAVDNLFASAVVIQIIPAVIVAAVLQRYITRLKIVDPSAVVMER